MAHFSLETRFLAALGITVVVETAVILCLIRLVFKLDSVRLSWPRGAFAGFFASFATLPYLWFVLPAFVRSYPISVVSGELGVFVIEAIAYVFLLNLPLRKTLLLSLSANLASIIAGLVFLPPL